MIPIVTSAQMKQVETRAFEAGESEQLYMENAGKGIAHEVEAFLVTPRDAGTVYLLVGKGNNGGDALYAGALLLEKGYEVVAYCLYPNRECSHLSKKMGKRFEKAGGQMVEIFEAPEFGKGVILDGLVGTGFTGKAEGLLGAVIEEANESGLPIFAIDIPSGLNGNTGAVEGPCMQAMTTLFLGYPKMGFFLGEGWDYVGKLIHVDFGMPEKFSEDLMPQALLMTEEKASEMLPKVARSRHKYEAGYVLAIAGNPSMPGAAILSCLSALKAGAGIIRLFHPGGMKEALSNAPFELIKEEWDLTDPARILEEGKRAKAFLIGPGMGRDAKAAKALEILLPQITVSTVIDADALYHLAEKEVPLPEKTVLTPHHGEMQRLLKKEPNFENCQEFAKKHKATIVLKGGPTVVFSPHTTPMIVPQGDPGMATAGTGDVLTGVIAAFLAQGLKPREAALLGAVIHGVAGEEAADSETSYGVIASDLIHFIPDAIGILSHRSPS